jgi:hypothetical protein
MADRTATVLYSSRSTQGSRPPPAGRRCGDVFGSRCVTAASLRAQHRAFEAGEAEKCGSSCCPAAGWAAAPRPCIAFAFASRFDRRAAGDSRGPRIFAVLSKRLAQRHRRSWSPAGQNRPTPSDAQQLAMPARNQQQADRENPDRGIDQPRRQRMALQVVDQRSAACPPPSPCAFARDQPDHHPADQPRPGGRGDGIDRRPARQPRIGQRGPSISGRQPFGMGAGGDFGHHTAIGAVS